MSSSSTRAKRAVDKEINRIAATTGSGNGAINANTNAKQSLSNTGSLGGSRSSGSGSGDPVGTNVPDAEMVKSEEIEFVIPSGTRCKFVGEGAANVVFEMLNVSHLPHLRGRLLRLPKTTNALDYKELQKYWEDKISPLFKPEEVVQQSLVRLPNEKAFLQKLNHELMSRDMAPAGSPLARRPTFTGYKISLTLDVGMLVEDMRGCVTDDCQYILREVKPKWLTQAPNAPRDTQRCRNCAREALRNRKSGAMNRIFCPLNLVKACDFPAEKDAPENIAKALKPPLTETETAHLTSWLQTSSLPKRIREAQWENHHETPPRDMERWCLAMTLRDCSLFLKIPVVPKTGDLSPKVVAKLGDLDKKNFVLKKAYWENMDAALQSSSFYESQDAYSPLINCQLPFYKGRYLTEDVRKYYDVLGPK